MYFIIKNNFMKIKKNIQVYIIVIKNFLLGIDNSYECKLYNCFYQKVLKLEGKKMKNWGCCCLMVLFKCELRIEYRKGV